SFPARIDQVELAISDEIETVKTELAPTGRATGRVVFINRTEDSFFLPYSTTVSTSAGEPVEFRTLQTVTVPSGIGSTSSPVSVIAMETGPRGNVAPTQINRVADGAYSLLARVVNEQATGGGSMEPARIVEESDKERLQAFLRQRIQQEGLEQLKASLSEQEFIPPETVEVIVLDVKYREFSGDFSDTFGGEMQAVVRATVIGGYNANRLALAALDAQIPPGFELDLDGLKFGAGEVLNVDGQTATFKIFASGKAVPNINDREIAKDVVGMSIGEAQNLLEQQYPLATVPGVDLRPSWLVDWLGRLPFSSLRINVVINDAVTFVADGD
ncbi:MAG: baseplate J/gp47 family protein, partial [Anaerolineae bacterium]|nr:baseplate J/gp47 family protein [Anaerolineae bacterium]